MPLLTVQQLRVAQRFLEREVLFGSLLLEVSMAYSENGKKISRYSTRASTREKMSLARPVESIEIWASLKLICPLPV